MVAVAIGGLVGPIILLLGAVLVPAIGAGVARPLVRTTLLLSLPIAISVVLVNVFFFPGGQTVLFRIGPITATAEGLVFALEILARILAIIRRDHPLLPDHPAGRARRRPGAARSERRG